MEEQILTAILKELKFMNEEIERLHRDVRKMKEISEATFEKDNKPKVKYKLSI